MDALPDKSAAAPTAVAGERSRISAGWWTAGVLGGLWLLAHADVVAGLMHEWRASSDYSVGALVLPAALYLLWMDADRLTGLRVRPAWGWGLAVFGLGTAMRFAGTLGGQDVAGRYGMLISLAGVILMVAGRKVFVRLFWLWLFLFLMVPLPGMLHNRIALPLQTFATDGALVALQIAGVEVSSQGNTLVLNQQVEVAVAEACSGLRMLTAFIVVASFWAYLVHRPGWQKVVLVISSIPVAILCNLLRLVATAAICLLINSEVGQKFFHDYAGLSMMPLAVILLGLELRVLSMMTIEDTHDPG